MAEADMMNIPVGQKPVYWDPYDPGIFAEPYPVLKRLREEAPGVYSSTVKLPAAGNFDVAFLLNQPQIIHCFSTQVAASPTAPHRQTPRVEFLNDRPSVQQGSPFVPHYKAVVLPPEKHRGYALQWFLLAVAVLGVALAASHQGRAKHE
mgnify:CR=1 FL=1